MKGGIEPAEGLKEIGPLLKIMRAEAATRSMMAFRTPRSLVTTKRF
jgi:hypothetical protein